MSLQGARLGNNLGAEEHSFLGISGVGSIIATFQHSQFYNYGLTTINSGTMPLKALELLSTLITLNTPAKTELPLTRALLALGNGQLTPTLLIDKLMRRRATEE